VTYTPSEGMAEDPLQESIDSAERLARLVAEDDDQRFVLVFHALINVLDPFITQRGSNDFDQARAVLGRTAEPMVSRGRRGLRAASPQSQPAADSIYADPVFLENAKNLIPNRQRIIGGIPTSDFPDCVAVGSDAGWCCTGTLVAPNVVVSAGHCVAGGCASRVFVGQNVDEPGAGEVISVLTASAHPEYAPPQPNHDLSVLVLSEDASVEPRAIAGDVMLRAAGSVRVTGFGNTDVDSTGGYGRRRMVDVPLASDDPKLGADPKTEFVAGAPFLDRDSCNGDSGGPAYVQANRRWYLAGATSRATNSTVRPCGDGGIYTRVNAFAAWVRSVPGGHWT
jgi:secreted trypsin-like serine protease